MIKLPTIVKHLSCKMLLAHVRDEHTHLPDDTERAPTDSHGVHFLADLRCQQDSKAHGIDNLAPYSRRGQFPSLS